MPFSVQKEKFQSQVIEENFKTILKEKDILV